MPYYSPEDFRPRQIYHHNFKESIVAIITSAAEKGSEDQGKEGNCHQNWIAERAPGFWCNDF